MKKINIVLALLFLFVSNGCDNRKNENDRLYDLVMEAKKDYENSNYENALIKLEMVTKKNHIEELEYLVAWLRIKLNKNMDETTAILEKVIKTRNNSLKFESYFLLLISYFKANRYDKADLILRKMLNMELFISNRQLLYIILADCLLIVDKADSAMICLEENINFLMDSSNIKEKHFGDSYYYPVEVNINNNIEKSRFYFDKYVKQNLIENDRYYYTDGLIDYYAKRFSDAKKSFLKIEAKSNYYDYSNIFLFFISVKTQNLNDAKKFYHIAQSNGFNDYLFIKKELEGIDESNYGYVKKNINSIDTIENKYDFYANLTPKIRGIKYYREYYNLANKYLNSNGNLSQEFANKIFKSIRVE
ncbi:MAG: hypothetical protein GXX85_15935 [Ignavibacteria bacterium]|nr:hypothetical protein [Ignavibacteria bacterium]